MKNDLLDNNCLGQVLAKSAPGFSLFDNNSEENDLRGCLIYINAAQV